MFASLKKWFADAGREAEAIERELQYECASAEMRGSIDELRQQVRVLTEAVEVRDAVLKDESRKHWLKIQAIQKLIGDPAGERLTHSSPEYSLAYRDLAMHFDDEMGDCGSCRSLQDQLNQRNVEKAGLKAANAEFEKQVKSFNLTTESSKLRYIVDLIRDPHHCVIQSGHPSWSEAYGLAISLKDRCQNLVKEQVDVQKRYLIAVQECGQAKDELNAAVNARDKAIEAANENLHGYCKIQAKKKRAENLIGNQKKVIENMMTANKELEYKLTESKQNRRADPWPAGMFQSNGEYLLRRHLTMMASGGWHVDSINVTPITNSPKSTNMAHTSITFKRQANDNVIVPIMLPPCEDMKTHEDVSRFFERMKGYKVVRVVAQEQKITNTLATCQAELIMRKVSVPAVEYQFQAARTMMLSGKWMWQVNNPHVAFRFHNDHWMVRADGRPEEIIHVAWREIHITGMWRELHVAG